MIRKSFFVIGLLFWAFFAFSKSAFAQTIDLTQFVAGTSFTEHDLSTGEHISFTGDGTCASGTAVRQFKNSNYEQFCIKGTGIYRQEDTSWAPLPGFVDAHCSDDTKAIYTLLSGCGHSYAEGAAVTGTEAWWAPASTSVGSTWSAPAHTIMTIKDTLVTGGAKNYCSLKDLSGYPACIVDGQNKAVVDVFYPANSFTFCTGVTNPADMVSISNISGAGAGDHFYYMKGWGLVGFEAPGFEAGLMLPGKGDVEACSNLEGGGSRAKPVFISGTTTSSLPTASKTASLALARSQPLNDIVVAAYNGDPAKSSGKDENGMIVHNDYVDCLDKGSGSNTKSAECKNKDPLDSAYGIPCGVSGRKTTDTELLACEDLFDNGSLKNGVLSANPDGKPDCACDPTGHPSGYCNGKYCVVAVKNKHAFEGANYVLPQCNGVSYDGYKIYMTKTNVPGVDFAPECSPGLEPTEPPESVPIAYVGTYTSCKPEVSTTEEVNDSAHTSVLASIKITAKDGSYNGDLDPPLVRNDAGGWDRSGLPKPSEPTKDSVEGRGDMKEVSGDFLSNTYVASALTGGPGEAPVMKGEKLDDVVPDCEKIAACSAPIAGTALPEDSSATCGGYVNNLATPVTNSPTELSAKKLYDEIGDRDERKICNSPLKGDGPVMLSEIQPPWLPFEASKYILSSKYFPYGRLYPEFGLEVRSFTEPTNDSEIPKMDDGVSSSYRNTPLNMSVPETIGDKPFKNWVAVTMPGRDTQFKLSCVLTGDCYGQTLAAGTATPYQGFGSDDKSLAGSMNSVKMYKISVRNIPACTTAVNNGEKDAPLNDGIDASSEWAASFKYVSPAGSVTTNTLFGAPVSGIFEFKPLEWLFSLFKISNNTNAVPGKECTGKRSQIVRVDCDPAKESCTCDDGNPQVCYKNVTEVLNESDEYSCAGDVIFDAKLNAEFNTFPRYKDARDGVAGICASLNTPYTKVPKSGSIYPTTIDAVPVQTGELAEVSTIPGGINLDNGVNGGSGSDIMDYCARLVGDPVI